MRTRALLPTSGFERSLRRLLKRQPQADAAVHEALTRLEADAFDSRLRTHKLKGALEGLWSCSAAYDLRIVFEFVRHDGAEAILLHALGTHDEVY